MNNYVLISRKTEVSEHLIDSASDDLETLSRRMESLNSKGYYENKIFQLTSLSTGKEYINDKIESIAKSMTKFQFYPIYRIRTTIEGLEKLSMTTYFMANDLILTKDEFSKVIDSINECMTETLDKCRIDKLIKGFKVTPDLFYHRYKLIGMDSWIMDPIGSYYTNSHSLSTDELKKSFEDYKARHLMVASPISEGNEENEGITSMDFSKFSTKRAEDMPIYDKYLTQRVRIEKYNKLTRLFIDE